MKVLIINFIKGLFIIPVFLYVLCLVINYFSCLDDIISGNLIYEKNIGWIDLNHSIPDGVYELLWSDTIKSYRQSMKLSFLQQELIFGSEIRIDLDSLSINRKAISFLVFQKISNHFEEFQGQFPFYWVDTPFSSSFSQGDLTGNLISFYCAANKIELDTLIDKLELASKEETFELFLTEANFKNKEWNTQLIHNYLSSIFIQKQGTKSIDELSDEVKCIPISNPHFFLVYNKIRIPVSVDFD